MKGTKMAHPSQVREITSPADIERYLANGWCELKQPVSQNARKQRLYRQRRKSLGQKRITAYLDNADAEALLAARVPGETVGQLLVRLLRACREKGQGGAHE